MEKAVKIPRRNQPMCPKHKPVLSKMYYLQAFAEADKRIKNGQKQKQCPDCLFWFFKDEY